MFCTGRQNRAEGCQCNSNVAPWMKVASVSSGFACYPRASLVKNQFKKCDDDFCLLAFKNFPRDEEILLKIM
jgi:hypothetical protein